MSGDTNAAVRHEDGQVYVDAPAMERLVGAIFERAGCDAEEVHRIAWQLTGANLRGHDSHGVLRTRRYVEWMEDGRVFPGRSIKVERETEALAVVDGDYGFGQTVGEQTVDLGVEKARRHGVAVTALKNAGHLGRIGDWAERAAESDCASIHMVNVRGSLIVAHFGAVERRGSTSPVCAAAARRHSAPGCRAPGARCSCPARRNAKPWPSAARAACRSRKGRGRTSSPRRRRWG